MLKKLDIENLKSIDKSELRLAPLTILTGVNSSGKSTVIQALMLLIKYGEMINRYSMDELTRYLNDFSAIRNKHNNARNINILACDEDNIKYKLTISSEQHISDGILPYIYESQYKDNIPELFYLNANRVGAQEYVSLSERKVGILGEYVFSTFDKVKDDILPDYLIEFNESQTVSYQVRQWLSFISGSLTELITEKFSDQVQVSFKVKDLDSNVSPFNLGAGMSYIAKVIIVCLMARKGDLILLENPEVQLHPSAQAKLGVFLSFIASKGIQIIVETHCEHLINKIAYEIYDDKIDCDDVIIYYKSDANKDFDTIKFDCNGEFNDKEGNVIGFPRGFFDATLSDLMAMR
ncbi:TPA: AAA family ATPase [Photobacterium damselae]